MELQHPFRVVTPTVDGDVLAVLARADAEFTPPQVHDVLGRYSEAGIRKVLGRLVEQGIVLQRPAGRAALYRLNRAHLAAPAVVALASLFDVLISRLQERIEGWHLPCAYAALFGSAVRGEMRPDSDLDLFIVRADDIDVDGTAWRDQLDALSSDVTAWTGNDARILEYSADDVRREMRVRGGVLDDITAQGLRLAGPPRYLRRPAVRGA